MRTLLSIVFLVVGLGFGAAAWAIFRDKASYPHKALHIWTCLIGAVFFLFLSGVYLL